MQFHSFSPNDLTTGLRALGIAEGDVVFAHIAYDEFTGFTGRPTDVISSLREAISISGTLLMASMPFGGTAVDYVQSGKMFDVRGTPSRMGLVTEMFRRAPGTLRSLHPTHPVLANGPAAKDLISEHQIASTPCGAHSPFAKLLNVNAKIALLGTGIGALTFFHFIEELVESALPQSPFTKEMFHIAFRGYSGEMLHVTNRLYDSGLSRRRDLSILERELRKRGEWQEARAGRVAVVVIDAQAVCDAATAMAKRGVYCYR